MSFYKKIYILTLLFFPFWGEAQTPEEQEKELTVLFDKLQFAPNDKARDSVNTIIIDELRKFIETPKSFTYDFKELKKLGTLRSHDYKLRIYNWNTVDSEGKFRYYGFLQYYAKKKKAYAIHELTDKSSEIQNPDIQVLSPNNWYGALYYDIVYKKHKRQKVYTLLGWDGNDNFTNKKIIETLSFDKQGEATFGLSVLGYEGNAVKKRLIFEFGEKVKMLLHYDLNHKMIVWDHLSPTKPELKGQYMFYGPDFSYDGLYFNKGKWEFYSNLNITNTSGENPTGNERKSDTIIPKK